MFDSNWGLLSEISDSHKHILESAKYLAIKLIYMHVCTIIGLHLNSEMILLFCISNVPLHGMQAYDTDT